jgi:hypothetical protein
MSAVKNCHLLVLWWRMSRLLVGRRVVLLRGCLDLLMTLSVEDL